MVLAALAFGAHRVRALLLPGWSGPPARLAEAVLAVAGLIWVCEALGTVGLFEEGVVLGALVAAGLAAGLLATRLADGRPLRPAAAPPAPPAWGLAGVIAVLACAALAAAWMVPTLGTLAAGMDRADSLWYHMPFAARFVQTGYLGHIYFFDPIFLASFYPANSEVLHAVPILFTGRDSVSPVLNLGWLSMALLAAWCIGRPYGLGPQALIGASVALGSQSLVEFQAGEALNDITGVALILAAAALLVNGYAAGGEERGRRTPEGVASPLTPTPGAQSLRRRWPWRGSRPGSPRERSSPSWRRSPPSRSLSSPSPPGRRACAPRPFGGFRCWPRAATGTRVT